VETVERIIPAPPARIFSLVANPRRHKDIDGSGSVRDAHDVPDELSLGSTFGMNMEMGAKYSMVSTVIEYESDRRIAWQSRTPEESNNLVRHLFGGRIWRYELEPVEGGTRVRESWDLTQERNRWIVRAYRRKTRKNMAATLERIEQIVREQSE
jgi:uncharacterized protein YndB with AHSA1/START domain